MYYLLRNTPGQWVRRRNMLILCFIAIMAIVCVLISFTDAPPTDCNRIDWNGDTLNWCLGTCYTPARLQSVEHIVSRSIVQHYANTLSNSPVPCKLHAAQVALLTVDGGEKMLYGKYKNTGTILVS